MRASLALLVVCAWAWTSPAHAFDTMVILVPNPALAVNSEGEEAACITCHNNPDGGAGCTLDGGTAPCLNPFGLEFSGSEVPGTADRTWTLALALLDADLDGFTNGQELQDIAGTWTPGQPRPGKAAQTTPPGDPAITPGDRDEDGDGYCFVGQDLDEDGNCTGAEENDGELDCNDSDDETHSGADEVCSNRVDDDCNGAADLDDVECGDIADRDGDGFCPKGIDENGDGDCIDEDEARSSTEDCDDLRAATNPDAIENCTDARDNDCDDDIDLAQSACTSDEDGDGDGYCRYGADGNDDGDCLDEGENQAVGDCDDGDVAIGPTQLELCTDALDNDCDGATTFEDEDCRHLADRDGDGYCPAGIDDDHDGNCAGDGEGSDDGDCNDDDVLVSPEADEMCLAPGLDADCDELADLDDDDCVAYTDIDGDRFCAKGEDLDGDGECTSNRETTGYSDCNDAVRAIKPGGDEVCDDQEDNDCNGSRDARDPACGRFRDADGDGLCLEGKDRNGDGDCSDGGEIGGATRDCDDDNATIFEGASEHCFDGLDNDCNDDADLDDAMCRDDVDADGDGYCPIGRDLSEPRDGDCTDRGENFRLSDCNDGASDVRPGLGESCTDSVDNNCDTKVDLADPLCARLLDQDADAYCPEGEDLNGDGDCGDEGEQRSAGDCDDFDSSRRPTGREVCDNDRDDDCDFLTDAADSDCSCEDNRDCVHGLPCYEGSCRSSICIYIESESCEPPPDEPDASTAPEAGTRDGGDEERDAGDVDAGPPRASEGGCDCSAPGRSRSGLAGASGLAFIIGLLALRRRRGVTTTSNL